MNKKQLAVAVLWGMGSGASMAQAQTSVTLYGVFDAAVEYVNRTTSGTSAGSRVDMAPLSGLSPSRWGIRGTEDLGGGTQALFWLESGFNPGTGTFAPTPTSALFSRQAAVGLRQAGIGQLSFGRQTMSLFDAIANFMPMRAASTYEPGLTVSGLDYRVDNAIKYAGDFGALHAAAHYSFGAGVPIFGGVPSTIAEGELPGHAKAQTAYGAGAYYYTDRFSGGLAYDQFNPGASANAALGTDRKIAVGASYNVGNTKFYAGYRWRNSFYGNSVTMMRDNFYWTGVSHVFSPSWQVTLAYYYDQVKAASLSPAAPAAKQPNFSQVSLLADLNLSKRTDVYVATAYAHNGAMNYDSLIQTGGVYGYGVNNTINGLANGQKGMFSIAAGVRMIF